MPWMYLYLARVSRYPYRRQHNTLAIRLPLSHILHPKPNPNSNSNPNPIPIQRGTLAKVEAMALSCSCRTTVFVFNAARRPEGPKGGQLPGVGQNRRGQGQDGIGWGRLCLACIQHTILGIPGSCSCSFCCCCCCCCF